MEEKVIYNPKDEQFKLPLGAITNGAELEIHLRVSQSLQPRAARVVFIFDRDNSRTKYQLTLEKTVIETDDYIDCRGKVTVDEPGLYWYYFEVETPQEHFKVGKGEYENRAVITSDPRSWQQTVYKRMYDVPEWLCGGVFYHIFVDRFCKGEDLPAKEGSYLRSDWGGLPSYKPNENGEVLNNDFFGGNLQGIIKKLPYLSELGVTCIYLSPIFSAYSNHKYDTADYMSIDPMFGNEEDFKELCGRAQALGIRVICDGVFNHTGSDSIYFDKKGKYGNGAWNNPDSPYRSWYYFGNDGSYESWWGFDTLPKLNPRDPALEKYLIGEDGVIRHWLRMGASGWRLDVVDELPRDVVQKLVAAAKAEKADALMLGEVWEDASNKTAYDERKNYFDGSRLDSVMNYPFKNSVISYVKYGNAAEIKESVESIVSNYPKEVLDCLMNLLGSHDNARVLTALADIDGAQYFSKDDKAYYRLSPQQLTTALKRLKIAVVIQMTLPGIPCIYYGDEVQMEGFEDPFNRRCFPWGNENRDLLEWYKKVIAIRRSHRVYAHGSYSTVKASEGIFAFERAADNESLITASNCGSYSSMMFLAGTYRDLLTGREYEGGITITPGVVMILEKITEVRS